MTNNKFPMLASRLLCCASLAVGMAACAFPGTVNKESRAINLRYTPVGSYKLMQGNDYRDGDAYLRVTNTGGRWEVKVIAEDRAQWKSNEELFVVDTVQKRIWPKFEKAVDRTKGAVPTESEYTALMCPIPGLSDSTRQNYSVCTSHFASRGKMNWDEMAAMLVQVGAPSMLDQLIAQRQQQIEEAARREATAKQRVIDDKKRQIEKNIEDLVQFIDDARKAPRGRSNVLGARLDGVLVGSSSKDALSLILGSAEFPRAIVVETEEWLDGQRRFDGYKLLRVTLAPAENSNANQLLSYTLRAIPLSAGGQVFETIRSFQSICRPQSQTGKPVPYPLSADAQCVRFVRDETKKLDVSLTSKMGPSNDKEETADHWGKQWSSGKASLTAQLIAFAGEFQNGTQLIHADLLMRYLNLHRQVDAFSDRPYRKTLRDIMGSLETQEYDPRAYSARPAATSTQNSTMRRSDDCRMEWVNSAGNLSDPSMNINAQARFLCN